MRRISLIGGLLQRGECAAGRPAQTPDGCKLGLVWYRSTWKYGGLGQTFETNIETKTTLRHKEIETLT